MERVVLREVDLDSLTGDEMSARIRELDAVRNQVEIELAETIAAWDSRQQWAADGALSAGTWLAWQCEMGSGEARGRVRIARRLRSMPATCEAARAGRLGASKVALLARASGRSEASAKAFERDEALLVEHAQKLTVDQLAVLLREWLARVDAEADDDDDTAKHQRRRLHLSELLDGMWRVDGLLDAEFGAWLRSELDRRSDEIKRREKDTDLPPSTPAQRRADALEALCRGDGAPAAEVVVVIRVEDLVDGGGGGHVEGGGRISARAARRLACDAAIRRVVKQGREVLDLGRSERLVTAAQRRALTLRDRGCVFPGCDRPPGRCRSHHIVHWVHGGATDLDNLCLLCDAHHNAVHERGFGLTRNAVGDIVVTRPDGQVLTPSPEP